MKVLIVCAGNRDDYENKRNKPFVYEQVEALRRNEVKFDFHFIEGGKWNYFREFFKIRQRIKVENFDIIHAHYGLSGLVSLFVYGIRKVVTFHGSDINRKGNNLLSSLAAFFCHYSIFVSKKLYKRILIKPKRYSVIPCGVDFDIFYPMDQMKARTFLGFCGEKKYILFSSSFDNPVKNYPLAKRAVELLDDVELIELKDKSREEVNLLFNASNLLLMTSFTEGSPQVVKEAMACNTPIVATDVGDVKEVIKNAKNCYISENNAEEIANKIRLVINQKGRANGRYIIQEYALQNIALEIKDLYIKMQSKQYI